MTDFSFRHGTRLFRCALQRGGDMDLETCTDGDAALDALEEGKTAHQCLDTLIGDVRAFMNGDTTLRQLRDSLGEAGKAYREITRLEPSWVDEPTGEDEFERKERAA